MINENKYTKTTKNRHFNDFFLFYIYQKGELNAISQWRNNQTKLWSDMMKSILITYVIHI